MKFQILRVLVLLVSISAASVLVWNATRNNEVTARDSNAPLGSGEMQGSTKSKAVIDPANLKFFEPSEIDGNDLIESPKSGGIIEPEDISEIAESGEAELKVTEEEVSRTRDMMMSTSKSGRIMSDDQIRKMLEERKKEELKYKKEPKLMPSSKSIDAILKPKDVEEIIEGSEPEKKKAPLMHSSKSLGGSLLTPEELEKMIEGVKQDSNAEQGSSPEVDPFAPSEERAK